MAVVVEIVPWQELPPLAKKLQECVANSDNFRAWMQIPEWLTFRWKPLTKILIAALRDAQTGDLLAVTPLIEHKDQLRCSIVGRGINLGVSGLLLAGGLPAFPNSDEYYEALCRDVLAIQSVDCLYVTSPKTSSFWRFLAKAQQAHSRDWLLYTPRDCYRYFYIDMRTSYHEYLCKFKGTTRQKLRGKLRQLEKATGGRLELLRICDAADTPQFIAAAQTIAEKSWQRRLMGFHVDQPRNRQHFLESMARQGVLRSYLLMSGEKLLAFLIGFQLNGMYYAHETAFDNSYAGSRFSPGQLLFYLTIKDCFEMNKPSMFYFGPGEYWYKNLFSNQIGEEVDVMILRNSVANRTKVMAHRSFRKIIQMIRTRGSHGPLAAIGRALDTPGRKLVAFEAREA
jgi:Acetyltransferase (GNAT) domain